MKLYESNTEQLKEYYNRLEKHWPKRKKKYSTENDYEPEDEYEGLFNQRQPVMIIGGIGHIHVYGMLLHDASEFEKMLGNTDYQDIQDDIDYCLEQGVKAIMFVVNSGGGMVRGAIETARKIKSIPVPTVAYVEGIATSAAYKLISGCSYIVHTESSSVGNIGAIMVYLDSSRATRAMGLNYISFVNDGASYKSIGHGDTSLTEEQMTYLQDQINKTGEQFKAFVSENRPELNPIVFKAGWYDGQEAVSLGLSDMVGTHDDAMLVTEQIINMNQTF